MKIDFKRATFCLLMAISTSFTAFADPGDSSSKQQQWEAMTQEVESWTDCMEKGVDPEIVETVVALNLLGFKTYQSCEGHLYGATHPWVTFNFNTPELQNLYTQWHTASDKAKELRNPLAQAYPDLSFYQLMQQHWEECQAYLDAQEECNRLFSKMEEITHTLIKPLYQLLDEFYATNFTSYDRTLFLEIQLYFVSLYSLGATLQDINCDREQKLVEYQSEMKKFTAFLKTRFFQGE